MTGHCIVCGLGDIGYRVVELLHRLGEEVVVVTLQAREERRRTAESLGVRIVMGDARADRLWRRRQARAGGHPRQSGCGSRA